MDGSSIAYAEGRGFSFEDESGIRPDFLQTIDYSAPRQRIRYQMNEFAEVCTFTGFPDTGIVRVNYIPQNKLVELKPMKYYFISFHNVAVFHEDVTSMKFNDLKSLLELL